MATLKNGANGSFYGKVGNVVGYQWRGKDIIRTLPRPSNKKRSDAQLANQQKMTLVQRFLQTAIHFIRLGFKHAAEKRQMSAFNLAMSYNKKEAITGTYPDLQLDYSRVTVSVGDVPGMEDGSARWVEGGVELTWADNSGGERAESSDYLVALLFFPEEQHVVYLFNGSHRDEGRGFIALESSLMGKPVHVYVSFCRYDGRDLSPSSYLAIA